MLLDSVVRQHGDAIHNKQWHVIAEAEVVGLADGTFLGLVPQECFWSQLGREFPVEGYIDNDATRVAVLKGSRRKPAYVRKYQRISIASLNSYFSQDGKKLGRIDSNRNTSDIFTKALDHLAHWRCVNGRQTLRSSANVVA